MKIRIFNKIKGRGGENEAALYLTKKHFKILQTNYSTKAGEIDIIAKDRKTLVFVEVKKRQDDAFGSPAQAVTRDKQSKIINAAKHYMLEKRIVNTQVRFDVIEICQEQINHIENAFDIT